MDAASDEDDTTSSLTTSSASLTVDETVSLSRVTAVANGWMFDFMFLSVCRCFRERNLDDFNASLNTLEAIIVNGSSPLRADQAQKKNIVAFLTRVMHGKDLNVKFEEDDDVLPLMSAVNIWKSLRKTVTEDSLFENIATLLLVQAVAVCLEKGQTSRARTVLKWLTERHDIAQNVSAKVSVVCCKADIYHPFLLNFSFDRLLETVQGYLDAYMERNPSDFLLKAATRMIQSKVVKEDSMALDESSLSEESTRRSTEDFGRRKKKLLLPKDGEMLMCQTESHKTPSVRLNSVPKDGEMLMCQPESHKTPSVRLNSVPKDGEMLMCQPEAHKTPSVRLNSVPKNTASRLTCQEVSPDESGSKSNSEPRKPRKKHGKWAHSMDARLKKGVERHGAGKWALILQDYDFSGRTSVMLKDRWRVLKQKNLV